MSRAGGSEARGSRKFPVGFAAAALLYLSLRGLILYTAFDRVALWVFELFPMGTIAELVLRGVDFPMRYYYDNAAGQILSGWLAVPCFALFGSSYLALKLVPLLLGFGALGLVWVFLDRSFGRTAANLGALLYAVGPPTLVKYSLICSGNHFENLFFTMLALVCAYELHRNPGSRRWLLASGFSSGLALFVFLGALIPVGILLGMHVGVRGVRRTLRDLGWLLPGFALGILPLVLINAATGARGLRYLDAKFGEEGARESGRVLGRIGEYIVHLPRCGVFEPYAGFSRSALGWIFLAAFAGAYLACLPGALRGIGALLRGILRPEGDAFERAKLVPLVLLLPLSALAFGFSNLKILTYPPPLEVAGYRYFLPTLLFAILAIAVVAARLWEKRSRARFAAAAVFAPALFAGLSSTAIVDWTFSRPNLGRYYEGYDLSKIGRTLLSARNDLPQEEIVARVQSHPPLVRAKVTRAVGFNLGVFLIERKGVAGALDSLESEMLERFPASLRVDLACGGGIAVRFKAPPNALGDAAMLDELARAWGETLPEQYRQAVVHGACHRNPALPLAEHAGAVLEANQALILRCLEHASDDAWRTLAAALAGGHGRLCGRLLRRGIPSDVERVRATSQWIGESAAVTSESFWEGIGAGVAEERESPAVPSALRGLPGFDAERVFLGLGIAIRRIHGDSAASVAPDWLGSIPPEHRLAFERGIEAGGSGP